MLDPNAREFIPSDFSFQIKAHPSINSEILNPNARAFIPFRTTGRSQTIKIPNQNKHLDTNTYLLNEYHSELPDSYNITKILNESTILNDILSSASAQSSPTIRDSLIYNDEEDAYPSSVRNRNYNVSDI